MEDDRFWQLKFGVEVSTRYHDWRRATYGRYSSIVKATSIIAAFVAFAAMSNWYENMISVYVGAPSAVVAASAVVALINILALTFKVDDKALLHTDLYKRFKALQEQIARGQRDWEQKLPEWEADAQAIRRDEPPTMWAVYFTCWNQTIERYQVERKGYYRPVGPVQYLLRNFLQFRPHDFPAQA